jgi:hypothetical protein
VSLNGPVEGQPAWPLGRELDEGLEEDGISQVPGFHALVRQQARQPLRRSFLIPKAAGQLDLTAGLLLNNGLKSRMALR